MKIGIIGAGNVGASIASQLICMRDDVKEIFLVDIFENFAKGRSLDLSHMAAVYNKNIKILGSSDLKHLKNFDYIVITAGKARKEGQSREDLLKENSQIVYQNAKEVAKFSPDSVIVVVTNPLDLMVYVAYKASGFDKKRILGMAGELDSARLRFEISKKNKCEVSKITAFVVGVHANNMTILKDQIKFDGKKLNMNTKEFSIIEQNTKNSGAHITGLLSASAFFAPGAGVVKMLSCMMDNKDEILSCCVLDDEEVPIGRFVKLSKNGVKEILDYDYGEEFENSRNFIKNSIRTLKYD